MNKEKLIEILEGFTVMEALHNHKLEVERDGNYIYVYETEKIPEYVGNYTNLMEKLILEKNLYRRKLIVLYITKNKIVVQLEMKINKHKLLLNDIVKFITKYKEYINWDFEKLPDSFINNQFIVSDFEMAYNLLTYLLRIQLENKEQ